MARMITARDNTTNQSRPLMNRKRSMFSIASEVGPARTTQRNIPELPKKRKGTEEMTWMNKCQKHKDSPPPSVTTAGSAAY